MTDNTLAISEQTLCSMTRALLKGILAIEDNAMTEQWDGEDFLDFVAVDERQFKAQENGELYLWGRDPLAVVKGDIALFGPIRSWADVDLLEVISRA